MPDGWQIGTPSQEQVDLINEMALAPMKAEELFVFPTWACNDQPDRDLDQFTKETVIGFVGLGDGLGPVGKSYMPQHNYGKAPEGRIFDAGWVEIDGVTWLYCWVYMAITDANKDAIQQIKAGVYWAVSVGVEVGKATCNICGKDFGSCGHRKGMRYDGIDCIRMLSEPHEFIELSGAIVLGAQYGAQTAKAASVDSIIKAASYDTTRGYSSLKSSEYEAILKITNEGGNQEMPITKAEALQFLKENPASLDELKALPNIGDLVAKAGKVDGLEATVGTVKAVFGEDLSEDALKAVKAQAEAGDLFVKDLRDEASRLHKIANKGEESEAMKKVIEAADAETLKGLIKEFESKADEVAPISCPKCGEKVSRKQSYEDPNGGGIAKKSFETFPSWIANLHG